MIDEHYRILKEYDICKDYQHDMSLLYADLKDFLVQKFPDGNIMFDPRDRLLFKIIDLDYFVDADHPGFALYNLQIILRELDIPNFFCAVVSNMPDYHRYTRMARDILRCDDVPLRSVSICVDYEAAAGLPADTDIDLDSIQKPFIVMSRLRRPGRIFFMAKLFESGLQNHGMIAYHNIDVSIDRERKSSGTQQAKYRKTNQECPCCFLTTMPYTAHNCDNLVKKAHNKEIFSKFDTTTRSFKNFVDGADIDFKKGSMEYKNNRIKNSLVYVALETVVKYPTAYQSGISLKSIAEKRPFVIFGAPGCLQLLKDQGFLTFDRWWDESYDSDPDIESRCDKILMILEKISKYNTKELQKLCREMEPILNHNYHHFKYNIFEETNKNIDSVLSENEIVL